LDRIGRYQVVEPLGAGGFATVYLAEDRNLGGLVAIKLLADSQLDHIDIVERFIAEARLMRNLQAPGVVTVYDSGEHEGRPYFVMEYCQRGNLAARVEQLGRALRPDEGLGLARAMAASVSTIHRADPPVVHRDLKPQNFLIRHTPRHPQPAVGEVLASDEELIVGDFGLAKVVSPDATRLTIVAYTRGFAPPEQVRGDPTTGPPADVYSASAVLVSMLTGVQPRQVLGPDQQPFHSELVAGLGPLADPLTTGLAADPSSRPQTIDHWIAALESAWSSPAAGPPRSATRPTVPSPASPGPDPHGSGRSPAAPTVPATRHPTPPAAQAPVVPSPPGPAGSDPSSGSSARPDPGDGAFGRFAGRCTDQTTQPPFADEGGESRAASACLPAHPLSAGGAGTVPASRSTGGDEIPAEPGRRRLVIGIGAVALTAAAGGAAVWQGRGPTIIGPEDGVVGDEVAFAVPGRTVEEWQVGGTRSSEQILRLVPRTVGPVRVEAVTTSGTAHHTFSAVEPDDDGSLRITGDAHLPVDLDHELTASGADGAVLTWQIGGQEYQQATVVLRPRTVGLVTVSVTAGDGRSARRVLTATERSPVDRSPVDRSPVD
jgi:serine/threonine protein kinase